MDSSDPRIRNIEHSLALTVQNVRSRTLGRYLADLAGTSFGGMHHGILQYIDRYEPVRIGDLAELVQLEPTTVSRHLATLTKEGVISRTPHPTDGRSTLISLSPRGKELLSAVSESWRSIINAIVEDWGEERANSFDEELKEFSEGLSEFVRKLRANDQSVDDRTGDM